MRVSASIDVSQTSYILAYVRGGWSATDGKERDLELIGKVKSVTKEIGQERYNVTFQVTEQPQELQADVTYRITIKENRKHRSLDANALLWACIGEIATATQTDKWMVYLHLLHRYGKYTYICVKPKVVEAVKAQWRECEVLGEVNINGETAVQLLCYFGSSTYDSKEFSALLDGVIAEMREIGLQPPPSADMRKALERLEEQNEKRNARG